MCLLMTFSNLDPSRAKCPAERNRDRVSNWKLDGLAREGYYNRRYIWFFPRINWSHRLGFFVIKMILYLEIRGQFACDNRERERGKGLSWIAFVRSSKLDCYCWRSSWDRFNYNYSFYSERRAFVEGKRKFFSIDRIEFVYGMASLIDSTARNCG